MNTQKALLLVGLSLVLESRGRCETSPPSLDYIKTAHKSALDQIRTISASFYRENTFPSNLLLGSGTYYKEGARVKIETRNNEGTQIDSLFKTGVWKIVLRNQLEGVEYLRAKIEPPNKFYDCGNIWRDMLMEIGNAEGESQSYGSFLERIKATAKVTVESTSYGDFVRITAIDYNKKGRAIPISIWHDVNKNYLIQKYEIGTQFKDDILGSDTITIASFEEHGHGIFIPIHKIMEAKKAGKLLQKQETKLTNIRINLPINLNVFVLPDVPSGTPFVNNVLGLKATIDGEWEVISDQEAFQQTTIVNSTNEKESQTEAEPISYNSIAFWFSFFVFCLCSFIFIVRYFYK